MAESRTRSAQSPRRFSWALHALWPLAVAAGLYGGHSTVSAFRADYMPAAAYAGADEPGTWTSEDAISPADTSDYDLGYRWASASDADDGQCSDASWSFRRGCIAYLYSEGRIAPPDADASELPEIDYAAVAYPPVEGSSAREEDVEPFDGGVLTLDQSRLPPHASAATPVSRAGAAMPVDPAAPISL